VLIDISFFHDSEVQVEFPQPNVAKAVSTEKTACVVVLSNETRNRFCAGRSERRERTIYQLPSDPLSAPCRVDGDPAHITQPIPGPTEDEANEPVIVHRDEA